MDYKSRVAYGNTLVELGKENKNSCAGCGSMWFYHGKILNKHFHKTLKWVLQKRICYRLLQDTQTGKIPFANSFAVFVVGRAYDQIRQTIATGKLNVKIVGSSAGLSDFGDGATHQSIEYCNYAVSSQYGCSMSSRCQ